MSSFGQISKVCALYKKILDLFDEESISGARNGGASLYILQEVLL